MQRAGLAAMLLLAAGAARAQAPVNANSWPDAYDHYFQKYSKRYFGPFWDWRWFKAQAIAESTLQANARNPSGAVGLMQLLPSTFKEVHRAERAFTDPRQPRWNIAAGVYYDHYLYLKPGWDALQRQIRLLASFAAYNAGYARALHAYQVTPKPVTAWLQLAPGLPAETRAYVANIVIIKTGTPLHRPPSRRGIAGRLLAGK